MEYYNVRIDVSAASPSQYPAVGLPEVAFAGRSNVGKSSLINALINRKNFAKTSSTPGLTRLINFYNVNNMLYLVDLPGYGYAKVSKDEIKKWKNIIDSYLEYDRPQLKLLLHLVDIRHEPTENDILMSKWVKANSHRFKTLVAATKADKIKKAQINEQIKKISNILGISCEDIIAVSADSRLGIEQLRKRIFEVLDI